MGRSAKTDEDRAKISVKMDPAESRGMNGFIVPCGGEAMPKVVSAPYGLGEPVRGNSVVLCNYRLPEHHPHECRVLEVSPQ